MKKLAALIESKRFYEEEECDVETNEKIKCTVNKTVTLIKKIENCKEFIGVSILFVCISVIKTEIIIYFCLKSKIFALLIIALWLMILKVLKMVQQYLIFVTVKKTVYHILFLTM